MPKKKNAYICIYVLYEVYYGRLVLSAGQSMSEWHMEDSGVSQDSDSSNGRNSDDGDDGDGGGGDGEDADHEVVASDLDHHTVTISEDVTITSLPLTQLPPIHLQLESKSVVFELSHNTL